MKKKHIGRVSVDSGQLMIMDPCYIENHWNKEKESPIYGVEFWGAGNVKAAAFMDSKGYNVENHTSSTYIIRTSKEEIAGKIILDLVDFMHENFEHHRIVWNTVRNSTYDAICKLTDNEEQAGVFNDKLGAVFRSGFGDGIYDVFATYKDCSFMGMRDERISKVEIVLIEDDE